MKKYYFGLLALAVLTIVVTAITLSHGQSAKRDEETTKKVTSISTKLMDYIYQRNEVPESLAAADIKDVPSTISYQRLDNERFKFCATFDRDSSSFDAGPFAFLTGLVFRPPANEQNSDEEKTYLDGYSLAYDHKKGENCQTVKAAVSTTDYGNYGTDNYSTDPGTIQ